MTSPRQPARLPSKIAFTDWRSFDWMGAAVSRAGACAFRRHSVSFTRQLSFHPTAASVHAVVQRDRRAQTRRLAGSGAQARLGPVLRRPRRTRSPRSRAARPGCRTPSGPAGTSRFAPATPNTSPASTRRRRRSHAVREAVGRVEDYQRLPQGWLEGLKLHAATLPLAEFAAVVGNLRARALRPRQRVADRRRCSARWTRCATPRSRSLLMHDLVRWDPQFDWTHKFFHTEQLGRDRRAPPRRRAAARVRTRSSSRSPRNFVFETGFTNVQFVGLSALAHGVGDSMFEKMVEQHPERRGAPRPDRRARARHRREARSRATRSTCSTSGSGAAGCCSRS